MARSIGRKRLLGKLRAEFAKAISDGDFTEEEERDLRSRLAAVNIPWREALEVLHDDASNFVRRALADVLSDGIVDASERAMLHRYLSLFALSDLKNEVGAAIGRAQAISGLSQGQLPAALRDLPIWLKAGEPLYARFAAQELGRKREQACGELFVTAARLEFISAGRSFSHLLDHVRRCAVHSRCRMTLTFHPKTGSGEYWIEDAPLASAFIRCLTRMANRTLSTAEAEVDTTGQRRIIPKDVRHSVWVRDGGRCRECQATDYLEYDHVIPVSKGGSNTESNIQLLCRRCNGKKSNSI